MIEYFLYLCLIIFSVSTLIVCRYNGYGFMPVFFSAYFIFVLIIPAIFHVKNNIFPFYGMSYSVDQQFTAVLILLLFSIFFWIGFFIKKTVPSILYIDQPLKLNQTRFFTIILLMMFFLGVLINFYGLNSFLLRRSDFDGDAFGDNSSTQSLVITLIRASAFACLFYFIILKKYSINIFWWALFPVVLSVFFIANYPLSLPRFILFSYIIAFFCFYFKSTFKNKILVISSFGFGITTLFPYTSHITRGEGDFSLNIANYYSSSGDFDSFQSIINVGIYVDMYGYTLGNQIASSLISFIPRSFWSAKGEPTGSITAAAAGYDYTNISSPLPAEFFIDFSYFGLIFISFLFGYFIRYVDQLSILSKKYTFNFILSIILISTIVIISRGAILAVINVIYAEIFVFYLMYYFILRSRV